MKRQFIDTIIEMKLDECEESIKEIGIRVEEIGRREPYIRKGTKDYEELVNEFHQLVVKRMRLEQAKDRLFRTYTRRNMEAFFEEYPTFEDFMAKGVAGVIVIKTNKGE
jgi:hypothetical protein